jgi:hypothetical protein
MSDSDDRRTTPRAPGVLDGVWYGSGQRCRITSLSVSGCYIESLTPPDKGARVRVRIELLQQGSVTIQAEVVYSEARMGFAVRFGGLSLETRKKLARTIDLLIAPTSPWDQPSALVS